MNKALMSVFTSLWLFSASGFAQDRELPSPAGTGSSQPKLDRLSFHDRAA